MTQSKDSNNNSEQLENIATQLLHADRRGGVEHGSVHKPTHSAVAYGYETAEQLAAVFQGKQPGYSYGRQNNPTTSALEQKITLLEDGIGTVCFATGMAAIASSLLALLRAGDHLIASRFLFGNTDSLFRTLCQLGIEVSFVDATDTAEVAAALTPQTRAVFVETLANPLTQVADLAAIGDFCEQHQLLYIVDNTMTSPVLFQPKTVKAGLVIHSLTKLLGGHGHVLGGAVTATGCFDWANFPHIYPNYQRGDTHLWGLQQIRKKGLRDMGATLPGHSAHLLAVGLETLSLRVSRACDNARRLAKALAEHPKVDRVYHPSLPAHPQHQRAGALFQDYGSLLSVDLQSQVDSFAVLNKLRVVILSSHLGDNRTLAIPVAQTIFYEMGQERRAAMGIAEQTLRISVGIEDIADLIADFHQALGTL